MRLAQLTKVLSSLYEPHAESRCASIPHVRLTAWYKIWWGTYELYIIHTDTDIGPTKLTVHYKIGRNPHEPCMRCMDACIPLVGLSALSYSLQDPRESCVTFVACSKGSKCPHERALTFPHRHEVCNEQTRLMSASRRIRGLATTHIILYLVYNTHIYLICPTYPPQRTRGCLTSTPSRLAALVCQRVPQQRQPTSAGAY